MTGRQEKHICRLSSGRVLTLLTNASSTRPMVFGQLQLPLDELRRLRSDEVYELTRWYDCLRCQAKSRGRELKVRVSGRAE